MRIALLSFEYPAETGFGGIGTYTWYQARALARLGHEVDVVAGSTEPSELRREDHDGVRVYRHRRSLAPGALRRGLGGARLWWTRNRIETAMTMRDGLARLIDRRSYDVVELPECGGEGALLPSDLGVPTLVKLHSPARLIMGFYDQPWLDRALCGWIEQRAMARATSILSCSRFLASAARDRLGVRRPIEVVSNGIDLELFDAEPVVDLRSRWGIPRDRPMIVFCGRLEKRKGAHVMTAVAERLLSEREVAVVFAGGDPLGYGARVIEPKLGAASKRGSFHLVGRLSQPEVRSCLRLAQIFVIPSLWENCPYSCLEAMAAGLGIVSSDAGGLPELVRDGESGLVVGVEDVDATAMAVTRLLDAPGLRDRLGRAARRAVETAHSDREVASRTVECYRRAGAA